MYYSAAPEVGTIFGLACGTFSVMQHRGRGLISRMWVYDRGPRGGGFGTGPERALVMTPVGAIGFTSLGFAISPAHTMQLIGAWSCTVICMSALFFRYSRLPIPRFMMPRWYRDGNFEVYRSYIERQRYREWKRAHAKRKR